MNKLLIGLSILFLTSCLSPENQNENENVKQMINNYTYDELCKAYDVRFNDSSYSISKELLNCNIDTLHLALDTKHKMLKVIYYEDDRKEPYEVDKCIVNTDAVAAMFFKNSLYSVTNDSMKLSTYTYQYRYDLCDSEPYLNQPQAAFCTSFLIRDTNNINHYMVSAGHCLEGMDIDDIRIIFNFKYTSPNQIRTTYHNNEIYSISEVIEVVLDEANDYSIFKLDKKIDIKPLEIQKYNNRLSNNIYVIGYPSGIPMKIADNALIRSETSTYFSADLDTYGGNSGSPVIDHINNKVIGILVRGEVDYIKTFDNNCATSKICDLTECRGEDVNFIDPVIQRINI